MHLLYAQHKVRVKREVFFGLKKICMSDLQKTKNKTLFPLALQYFLAQSFFKLQKEQEYSEIKCLVRNHIHLKIFAILIQVE